MRRDILIREIADICFNFGVIIGEVQVQKYLYSPLSEDEFLESLINTITIKTMMSKNVDVGRVRELLIELKKIRIEFAQRYGNENPAPENNKKAHKKLKKK